MKTMKQPRKDVLREQLALAATEIIELRAALIQSGELLYAATVGRQKPRPWWRRLLAWVGA